MAESKQFSWIPFYMELASKLVPFAESRATLIEKIKSAFQKTGLHLPKLEQDGDIYDIDPFTVFGMFNKGISNGNRIRILTGFAEEFGVTADVPEDFDGIPIMNNLNASFFSFAEWRNDNDIDTLWKVFLSAIEYADKQDPMGREKLISAYDSALTQRGVRWNITMGLYWIRPYRFINLDAKNRQFIKDPAVTTPEFIAALPNLDEVPNGKTYLELCERCAEMLPSFEGGFSSMPEMSYNAWASGNEDEQETVDALSDDNSTDVRYWMYSVFDDDSWNECQEKGIMVIGCDAIGDYMQYDSKEALRQALMNTYKGDSSRIMQALMTWCFSRVIKPNDVIIAKRSNTLVGRGIVTGDYVFDDSRAEFKNVRTVAWQQVGRWEHPGKAVAKRLTDISPYTEYVKTLNAIFLGENVDEEEDVPEIVYPSYTSADFLREVYMDSKNYETLVGVLKNKKNIILQGAPGVGKTFAAKRLAYSIMGEKDRERVMMVQFHQSYSYEDFIMGYRPTDAGFELRKGSFYNFCKQAEVDSDREYFFIIDEINRGNLSKIFGELFMLIETDKRGIELQLLYSDERFSVPKNLYIIGMMNTADRSLAMLDYALRRRFAFFELEPGFETDGFKAYRVRLGSERFDRLITCVERLNDAISTDDSLGEGFRIGHSYFCNLTKEKVNGNILPEIIEFEIIPLLKEYWFDEPTKVRNWSDELRSAIR